MLSFAFISISFLRSWDRTAGFIPRAHNILESVSKSFPSQGLYGIHLVEFANVIRFTRAGTIQFRDPEFLEFLNGF